MDPVERFRELYGHDPDADASEVTAFVMSRWRDQDPYCLERLARWSFNIQFDSGRQWIVSTDNRTWFTPPAPQGRVRVTNNLTHRAGQYRLSKLTESRPVPKVTPHSNEISDADRATVGEQTSLDVFRKVDMGQKIEEAIWLDWLCGSAYFWVGWDSNVGRFIKAKKSELVASENGEPQERDYFVDVEGNEVEQDDAHEYRLGDVEVRIVAPWNVRFENPRETDISRQRRVYVGVWEDVEEVRRSFGSLADDVTGSTEDDVFLYFEDLLGDWIGADYAFRGTRARQFTNRVLVIHCFERESEHYPNGRYIIVAGDQLLSYDELPFLNEGDEPAIPLVPFRTNFRIHDAYGAPDVENIIPIQKRINQLESHVIEYIRLFAKGGLVAEMGSVIEETFSNVFGSVLYYQGNQPSAINWPSLPNDVLQALRRAYENFDRISGWTDVARGEAPGQVRAARAILELKRSNDTPLGKSLERLDRSIEEVTAKIINVARWGYSTPRWIETMGQDVPHLVNEITSEDLPTRFSVKIETDSALRLSYPAKLDLMLELNQRGLVDNDTVMRILNFADWDKRAGQWNRDYTMARLKIENIKKGQPAAVEWYEDDTIHMLAISEVLKDPRVYTYPPEIRGALTELWLSHYLQWAQKQSGQLPPTLQQRMGMQGAPDPATAMPRGEQRGAPRSQPAAPGPETMGQGPPIEDEAA